jgi:hypothetical protein
MILERMTVMAAQKLMNLHERDLSGRYLNKTGITQPMGEVVSNQDVGMIFTLAMFILLCLIADITANRLEDVTRGWIIPPCLGQLN